MHNRFSFVLNQVHSIPIPSHNETLSSQGARMEFESIFNQTLFFFLKFGLGAHVFWETFASIRVLFLMQLLNCNFLYD